MVAVQQFHVQIASFPWSPYDILAPKSVAHIFPIRCDQQSVNGLLANPKLFHKLLESSAGISKEGLN